MPQKMIIKETRERERERKSRGEKNILCTEVNCCLRSQPKPAGLVKGLRVILFICLVNPVRDEG